MDPSSFPALAHGFPFPDHRTATEPLGIWYNIPGVKPVGQLHFLPGNIYFFSPKTHNIVLLKESIHNWLARTKSELEAAYLGTACCLTFPMFSKEAGMGWTLDVGLTGLPGAFITVTTLCSLQVFSTSCSFITRIPNWLMKIFPSARDQSDL